MNHVRAQIRQAVAAALTAIPTTEGRVYASRVYPHEALPAIGIYAAEETVIEDRMAIGGQSFWITRALILVLEVRAMSSVTATEDRFDDQIDQIAAEIEPVMSTDETWGGLAQATDYLGVAIDFNDELEAPLALARFQYRIVYQTDAADPTNPS